MKYDSYEYEGDVLNCIVLETDEFDYTNGKIVDDFNVLDKHYIYTRNVLATQQLHKLGRSLLPLY